ncbi:MAG: endolytic transglycosylase MltG [Cellvibrionaceae bacterium]|nr:endolytic transglycosylase MltG [Cellvibrionaceae bacterium]
MSRIINVMGCGVVVGMLLLTISAYLCNRWVNTPIDIAANSLVDVQAGDTLTKISRQLYDQGIIQWPRLWVLYARLTQRTAIHVGEYALPAVVTPDQLLSLLQSADVLSYSVTLVEGKTFADFLQTLQAQEKLSITLADKMPQDILSIIGVDSAHPEGWFFPDTYHYTRNTRDVDILRQAYQKMQSVLAEQWQQRSENLPYNTPYEALIMASIIEKETGVAAEREQIAGVFVRRLRRGMRLQTDPTVIYGLGAAYQGNLRRRHLLQKTPYNTYTINGLPPTPIAMPGREAIYAALHPADGDSLFFVAKGDGSHQFSATLAEHERAVKHFQIEKRAKNYRSSPK